MPLEIAQVIQKVYHCSCSSLFLRNQDGKVYYYNSITKASSWDEPAELIKAKKEAAEIDAQNGEGGNAMNPMMMMQMMTMLMVRIFYAKRISTGLI